MYHDKRYLYVLGCLALLISGTTVVQARLLLYEPFDYPAGELLDGQTPPAGLGMVGSWTVGDQQNIGLHIESP